MKMNTLLGLSILMFLAGCTQGEVENAAEDAAHETRQGVERAGERIEDATD